MYLCHENVCHTLRWVYSCECDEGCTDVVKASASSINIEPQGNLKL